MDHSSVYYDPFLAAAAADPNYRVNLQVNFTSTRIALMFLLCFFMLYIFFLLFCVGSYHSIESILSRRAGIAHKQHKCIILHLLHLNWLKERQANVNERFPIFWRDYFYSP